MKQAVVIGGTRGIGAGVVARLLADQWLVTATGVSEKEVADFRALDTGAECSVLDVTDDDSITAAVRTVTEVASARLFGLVNNAGLGAAGPFAENALETEHAMVTVNVLAPVVLSRGLLPGMIARARLDLLAYPAAILIPVSAVQVTDQGPRVLVVEDGPTLTHGEMKYGAGTVAAKKWGAAEIVDPRPYAVGSIKATYEKYPTTGDVLPAMGYGAEQTAELQQTIADTPAELVVIGTPIDLRRLIDIDKPTARVRYELQEIGSPTLTEVLEGFGD